MSPDDVVIETTRLLGSPDIFALGLFTFRIAGLALAIVDYCLPLTFTMATSLILKQSATRKNHDTRLQQTQQTNFHGKDLGSKHISTENSNEPDGLVYRLIGTAHSNSLQKSLTWRAKKLENREKRAWMFFSSRLVSKDKHECQTNPRAPLCACGKLADCWTNNKTQNRGAL